METYALAFLVRVMCSDLKHVIAYYFTENVTSYQLMSLFWKVVGILELSVNLWVCAPVNDGAPPNRKFFKLHAKYVSNLQLDVVHKVQNIFATTRLIYFLADACHLVKTARNCLHNSGSGAVDLSGTMVVTCCLDTLHICSTVIKSLLCTPYQSFFLITLCLHHIAR